MLNSTHTSLHNNANATVSAPFSAETDGSQTAVVEEFILPEQFFSAAAESSSRWSGERRLLFAVLQAAVESFLRHRQATTRRGKRLFSEDKEWFWAQDCDDLCSFASICGHLNLDPDYIRMGLKRAPHMPVNPLAEPQYTVSSVERRLSLVSVIVEEKSTDRGMPGETLQQLMHEIAA